MTILAPLPAIPPEECGTDPAHPPRLPYYLLHPGADGGSRLDIEALAGFALRSVGGGAAPQWMRDFPVPVEAVRFNILPIGWIGEWHESPKPQWVVPLAGRWFIETADGARLEMGPGDLHLGLDQGTRGGKGHRSGQIGDTPCLQIMVQFAATPAATGAEARGT